MEYAPLLVIIATAIASQEFTHYLDNSELSDYLRDVNDNYQNISHLYSIGTSGMGEELWVLMLSLAPSHETGVPNVKVVGNIHGNEPVGRELIIYFINMLLKGYADNNADIIHLLQNTKIHFLPTANPDGFASAIEGECTLGPGRKNSNGVDLNRDFMPIFSFNDEDLFKPRERETSAIMQWMSEINFVLSVSIHAGSSVVVYPYDAINYERNAHGGDESKTDDDDIFRYLASVYASSTMGLMNDQCPGEQFTNGISNGAAWYPATGTMGDYNYHYHGCMELTVETDCCKYPHPSLLEHIIPFHSLALLELLKEAHQGVKGVITCGGVRGVSSIQVIGRNITTHTTENGEYWRILLPGRYFLMIESSTCKTEIVPVNISKRKVGMFPEPVILNINLKKEWDINDDAIELDAIEAESGEDPVQNTTFQQYSNRTKHLNSTSPTQTHLEPQIQNSLSLSTLCQPSVFIVGVCWCFVYNLVM